MQILRVNTLPVIFGDNKSKGGDTVGKFYIKDSGLRAQFEALPVEVRNMIIESGIEITSAEQLEQTAEQLKNLSK